MSTSVTRDVACKFTDSSKIIIRITVNEEYLRLFKYIYFGDTLIIGDNNFLTENEFLLNLFTELQFTGKTSEEITYKSPYIGNTYRTITDTFSIFDMKFIKHSNYTPEEVKNILDKLVKAKIDVILEDTIIKRKYNFPVILRFKTIRDTIEISKVGKNIKIVDSTPVEVK